MSTVAWSKESKSPTRSTVERVGTSHSLAFALLEQGGEKHWFPTILPENRFRQTWQILMSFPLIWTGTVMPFNLCFVEFRVTEDGLTSQQVDEIGWLIMGWLVDAFFWSDLVAQFFFAIHDSRGNLVTNPKLIAKAYLKGWFLFDLIACLPPQSFALLLQSGSSGVNKVTRLPRLYRVGRIARLARLVRMSQMLRLGKVFRNNPVVAFVQRAVGQSRLASVAKFMVLLMGLAHLLGCLWYLIAALSEDPIRDSWLGRREGNLLSKPAFTHWATSVYFVLTVFTSVGFGDIYPVADGEVVFGMMLMLIGAVVNSVIVSEVIAVVTRVDGLNAEVQQKREAIQSYHSQVDLKDALLESKCVHFAELHTRAKYADRSKKHAAFDWRLLWEVLRDLPEEMKCCLRKRVYNGALVSNEFFRISWQDEKLLALLASAHLKQQFFEPRMKVFSFGDQPTGLLLVLAGNLAHVAVPTERGGIVDAKLFFHSEAALETEECPYKLSGVRSFSGEWELVYPNPRVSSVRAENRTTCLLLPQQAFIIIVTTFPRFLEGFKHHARRREKRRLDFLAKHKHPCSAESLAATQLQSFFRGKIVRAKVKSGRFRMLARASITVARIGKTINIPEMPADQLRAGAAGKDAVEGGAEGNGSSTAPTPPIVADSNSAGVSPKVKSKAASGTPKLSQLSPHAPRERSPVKKGAGTTLRQTSSTRLVGCAPTGAEAGDADDPTLLPQWADDLQQEVLGIHKKVEGLRKGQEDMERMMQQLYFLSFSNERSPQPRGPSS